MSAGYLFRLHKNEGTEVSAGYLFGLHKTEGMAGICRYLFGLHDKQGTYRHLARILKLALNK